MLVPEPTVIATSPPELDEDDPLAISKLPLLPKSDNADDNVLRCIICFIMFYTSIYIASGISSPSLITCSIKDWSLDYLMGLRKDSTKDYYLDSK
jgi:hypothetical protein